MEGKKAFEAMTLREQRELIDALPESVSQDNRKLYQAASLWSRSEEMLPEVPTRAPRFSVFARQKKISNFRTSSDFAQLIGQNLHR